MLREFFATFKEFNDPELVKLWTLHDEVPGIEQLMFEGNASCLTERSGPSFSLVIASQLDSKIFDHTRYLIQYLWSYWNEEVDSGDLRIDLYGFGYQAIIPLEPLYPIKKIYSIGTIESVDRFNNSKEKEIRNLRAIVFKARE